MTDSVELSQIVAESRQIDNARSFVAVFGNWTFILLSLYVASSLDTVLVSILVAFIIAGFQHKFFMIYHEAFHGILFTNRRYNDGVAKFLAAYPSLSTYEIPKQRHLKHHAKTATHEDPENISFMKSAVSVYASVSIFAAILKKAAALAGFSKDLPADAAPTPAEAAQTLGSTAAKNTEILQMIGTQVVLFVLLWALFGPYALLYWVSLLLVMPLYTGIRQWVEHYAGDLDGDSPLSATKFVVVRANPIEHFAFAPMNFDCHEAHHKYPTVPFYQLPRVQKAIEEQSGSDAVLRDSYLKTYLRNISLV